VTDGDPERSLLVVGFGNPMMGDDGIGPAVVRRLSRLGLPDKVTRRELSDVLHLPAAWSGEKEIWMVDAVIGGAPPGAIRRWSHAEVLSLAPQRSTAHHLGLAEGLRWVLHAHPEMAGVRFSLWGVEPETVSPIEALSAIVEEAVGRLADELSVAIQGRSVSR
jgi:hydrogenase maturation protease